MWGSRLNRGQAVKLFGTAATAVVVLAGGVALGANAVGSSGESAQDAPADRSVLVAVPTVGIEVPARTTELVEVSSATRLAQIDGGWVFRALGRGEFEGSVCIFAAAASGPSDVIPMACDAPEAVRSRGLDLGHSTPDGSVSGVVARDNADGTTSAQTYRVGPNGGPVTVRLDVGPPVELSFPNFAQLDPIADADARAFAQRRQAQP